MTQQPKTGWEPERRTHFDEIVSQYDSIRQEYPNAVFTDIEQYMGKGPGKHALEIGAGTGKATKHFLSAGYTVTAVEIGRKMAAFLLERFQAYKNFDVINASFEDARLQGDYDLIYAASAFHWVDAKAGCPKLYRLLANGGGHRVNCIFQLYLGRKP